MFGKRCLSVVVVLFRSRSLIYFNIYNIFGVKIWIFLETVRVKMCGAFLFVVCC